ncbi:hypothetical protein ONZ45_g19294 [Pleurotus djamor]|nr:hypothetical protein ONZ45_g19294 [Pleurotus djamor]
MPVSTNTHAQRVINEQMRSMRTLRNTHSAISSLSNEILARIFSFVKQQILEGLDVMYDFPALYNWMQGTVHVCQAWRNIGLDVPQLWTSVIVPSLAAPDILQRSKGLPIQIFVTHPCPNRNFPRQLSDLTRESEYQAQVNAIVPPNKHRIQKIYFHGAHLTFMQFLYLLGAEQTSTNSVIRHSSMLKVIQFAVDRHDPFRQRTSRTIPFWASLPNLHTLRLEGSPLISNALPFLPALCNLEAASPLGGISLPISITWLLHSLKNTPNVEDVEFSHMQWASDDDVRKPIHVHLPQLKKLILRNESYVSSLDVLTLLDFITMPTSTSLECSFPQTRLNAPEELMKTLLKFIALASCARTSSVNRLRPVNVGQDDHFEMTLSFQHNFTISIRQPLPSAIEGNNYLSEHGKPIFHIEVSSYGQPHKQLIETDAFPFSNIVRLTLAGYQDFTTEDAKSLLIRCTKTQVLEMSDWVNPLVVTILIPPAQTVRPRVRKHNGVEVEDEVEVDMPSLPLPKLNHIVLRNVSFRSTPPETGSSLAELLKQLVTRRGEIKTATIRKGSDIPWNFITALKALVNVEWDGEGRRNPTPDPEDEDEEGSGIDSEKEPGSDDFTDDEPEEDEVEDDAEEDDDDETAGGSEAITPFRSPSPSYAGE